MSEMTARFSEIVGNANLLTGDAIPEDYAHDEELTGPPQKPAYAAKPATPEEVAQLLKAASENGVPVTARGSGCGLSGAARPVEGGLLISFDRMNKVLEVDTANQVAVVQPGVALTDLDAATADTGLRTRFTRASCPPASAGMSEPTPAGCARSSTEWPAITCSGCKRYCPPARSSEPAAGWPRCPPATTSPS